jgi:thiamine-monophosphate kinase
VNGEWQLLDRIRQKFPVPPGAGMVLGIGDDCAIYRPRGAAEDLLFTTDLLLEDVHFRRATHRPEDVGWKALARGLSDIAAMGGEPRFFLVSLAVAAWAGPEWVEGFYRGLRRLATWRGVKSWPATSSYAARRRAAGRCGATGRALVTRSMFRAGWADRHWGWPGGRARRGAATSGPSPGWRWAAFCASACAPRPPWI